MSWNRKTRLVLIAFVVIIAAISLVCEPALAQCPLCKVSLENSPQGRAMAKGLNVGILVLLVPPVTVFCSIFLLAIKHRKTSGNG